MSPPTYKLYTPEASFRAFPILIAAEFCGVQVTVVTATESKLSPTGKLPLLENEQTGAVVFGSAAIARYVAGLRPDAGLLDDKFAVDEWIDWSGQQLEVAACVWFYPVAGYMPFQQASYEKAKEDFAAGLKKINDHLNDTKQSYLVGNTLTLADIYVASTLLYPFKLVADGPYRTPFAAVMSWFERCVATKEFQAVVGQVTLCRTELKADAAPKQK